MSLKDSIALQASMDYEAIKQVLAALEREGVRYVVFGAAALNFHGLARFTEDLDLFVAPDRENVEALKNALRSVFDDPHIDEISADDLLGEYPAVQYVPPSGTFHIDILVKPKPLDMRILRCNACHSRSSPYPSPVLPASTK